MKITIYIYVQFNYILYLAFLPTNHTLYYDLTIKFLMRYIYIYIYTKYTPNQHQIVAMVTQ